MNDSLKPGGEMDTSLPENWKEPNGWPLTGNVDAMWFAVDQVMLFNLHELYSSGWESFQMSTLVGRGHIDWTAAQFRTPEILARIPRLLPWEWVDGLPGGDGSEVYKTQHLGEYESKRITVVGPGVNVQYPDGSGGWSEEPLPVIRVMDGGGYETIKVVPTLAIEYDWSARLWRRVASLG